MNESLILLATFVATFLVAYLVGARLGTRRSAASPNQQKASSSEATPTVGSSTQLADAKDVKVTPDDLPKIDYEEEDAAVEPTKVGERVGRGSLAPPLQKIVYDEDAAIDEPTHSGALILVTATAQTDRGVRRKRNEDSILAREDVGIFVVADGMGGYRGGEIASQLAVETIEQAFVRQEFVGPTDTAVPKRASELALAIQMANEAIFDRAGADKHLEGMGTTICAARFSPNKQRVYVGHVGDSRVYLLRDGDLRRMTTDHTMGDFGVAGEAAGHLSRAVGVWPIVPIDIVLGKPRPGDVYLLCSDGLSKMVSDDEIQRILLGHRKDPQGGAEALIAAANANGGKDNVSVIVVRVDDPAKSERPASAA